jgi:hypothetical protein
MPGEKGGRAAGELNCRKDEKSAGGGRTVPVAGKVRSTGTAKNRE